MGWKGAVRSMGAAVRAAERDAKRRQRELEKQRKQVAKMQELEQAAYEVEVYENHIDIIQSIHKECSVPVNWKSISLSKKPSAPKLENNKEADAQFVLDNYKPGLIDWLLKRQETKKKRLLQKIVEAIELDKTHYESKYSKWELEVEDWEESVGIAKALLVGESKAKIKVIDSLNLFSEISNLGSSLSIVVHDSGILEAIINVHSVDIVPSETKSLLKSGKLSVKKMAAGKFNEIYQDYVCSCALRVGNELFSSIPDELVLVTAVDELLNSKTGHLEEAPILSVVVSRSTVQSLNLELIDPSDSMVNFKHNMSFKKTKGFERVERISLDGLKPM